MTFSKEIYNKFVGHLLDGWPTNLIKDRLNLSKKDYDDYLMTYQYRERQLKQKAKLYYKLNDYCDRVASEQSRGEYL